MSEVQSKLTTVREILEPRIQAAGGWANVHVHADKAYTISPEMLHITQTCTLQQKWDAIDQFKRQSTESDIYDRFCRFFETMIEQGCTACASYVDIDSVIGDKAIKAGFRAREKFLGDLTVKFINQAIKGVIEPEGLIARLLWSILSAEFRCVTNTISARVEKRWMCFWGQRKQWVSSCNYTLISSTRSRSARQKSFATKRWSMGLKIGYLPCTVFPLLRTRQATENAFMR